MNGNIPEVLLKEIQQVCDAERKEVSSPENLYYAHEHGNQPAYQYFMHGGPNRIWKNHPIVRDFLRIHKCILLPDFETFLDLQCAFSLSPRSRRLFQIAQALSKNPNLNPTDSDFILYFITTWGGVWFAKHFTYPDRVLMTLQQESRI